ncbi:hypothetical protein [Plesiomonas shigelloides]|uniref:hypothetical protein n=1 Tax=Plesiomonas shigelloides TaxID=703 RepID=UPI001C5B880E|nr:hypothetical protein [Plesiomonas shigelloides]MBW3794208.1 hypothetical protein [Plesiomonas shigelloides]
MQDSESVIRQAIIPCAVLSMFSINFLSIIALKRTALTVEQLQSKDYAGDERRGADMTPVLLFVRA